MSNEVSSHYNADYFAWQAPLGEFGGWANLSKFSGFVRPDDEILDFGCGGGYLLQHLKCKRRSGVEVNPSAAEAARAKGLEIFPSAADVPDNYVDLLMSNSVLEHCLHPLNELKTLLTKVRPGGRVVFFVPCESTGYAYKPNDINYHLYSWSPMCIGNLFTEAGFSVQESAAYLHKWPPFYRTIAKVGGRSLFEVSCRIYGQINRVWSHVRVLATRPA